MKIRNRYTYVGLFLWVIGMCFAAHPLQAQSVTPVPLKMERGTGFFQLAEDTPYETNLRDKDARWLARTLQTLPVRLIPAKQAADATPRLTLRLTDASAVLSSPESYTLSVTPDHIRVEATSVSGLFYGVQSLDHIRVEATSVSGLFYGVQSLGQLVTPAGTGFTVPAVEIEDTPRLAYRGFMLDVSRHFFPKEFVKKQIDALASYKINRLHLHLTDASGWRIEIKKYPRLTQLAAWRSGANWNSFFPKEFVKKQIDALARYKINRLHLHLTDAAGWRIEIKKYPRLTQLAAWRSGANWKSWWNADRRYLPEGTTAATCPRAVRALMAVTTPARTSGSWWTMPASGASPSCPKSRCLPTPRRCSRPIPSCPAPVSPTRTLISVWATSAPSPSSRTCSPR